VPLTQRVAIDLVFQVDGLKFEAQKAWFRVPLTGFSSPFDCAVLFVANELSDAAETRRFDTEENLPQLVASGETFGTWRPLSYLEIPTGPTAKLEVSETLPRSMSGKYLLVKLISNKRRNSVVIAEFAGVLGSFESALQPVAENVAPVVVAAAVNVENTKEGKAAAAKPPAAAGGAENAAPKSLMECYKSGQCTIAFTHRDGHAQEWQECHTCHLNGGLGACLTCIQVCHAGHDLGEKSSQPFYCDCGADREACKSKHGPKPELGFDPTVKKPEVKKPPTDKEVVADCVARKRCTRTGTGSKFVVQKWWCCNTCQMTMKSGQGLCESCRDECHAGHDLVLPPANRLNNGFYCDCFDRSDCKCSK
jgi:hypothetical protein